MNWRTLTTVSVAVSVLSLAVLREPDYDPTAWLIWGRQLTDGTLSMIGGPSWKPLPVAFTTVFAFGGDTAAPLLWLVLTRLSGFAALAVIYLVGVRLGNRRAGLIAATGMALTTDFLFNCFRGDSEGLLVLFAVGALLLHLQGRSLPAFGAAVLTAGVRPEVWPLLAAYGLWLAWRDRRLLLPVAAGGAFVLAAWFVPDYVVTGDWLRGAGRAQNPVEGSPAQSAFPFGMTLLLGLAFVPWPLFAGAIVSVVEGHRRGERTVLVLAAAAAVLWVTVGVMAEAGFTGNIRYSTLPGALVCILGGLGLDRFFALLRGRSLFRPAVALAAVAVVVSAGIVVSGAVRLVQEEQVMGDGLDQAIELAGGEARIRGCGRVSTTPFERQQLSWELGMRQRDVFTHAETPGIMFVRRGQDGANASVLPVRDETDHWVIRSTCSGVP